MKHFDESNNFQQLSLTPVDFREVSPEHEILKKEILEIDVNEMTPMQAMQKLIQFQEQVKKMK